MAATLPRKSEEYIPGEIYSTSESVKVYEDDRFEIHKTARYDEFDGSRIAGTTSYTLFDNLYHDDYEGYKTIKEAKNYIKEILRSEGK